MKAIHLILASASPRRAELLKQIGLKFQVMPGTVDEKLRAVKDPRKLAIKLALDKARDVAARLRGRQGRARIWVLGADTLVWLKGRPLGKPRNPGQALRMLRQLSGKTHQVITGLALVMVGYNVGAIRPSTGSGQAESPLRHPTHKSAVFTGVETTSVTFRKLSDHEIRDYVATGEPLDKAGAYGIQGLAGPFVKKINGCYFNVVGLPLARLNQMLQRIPEA
jgi:septum formation protein